MFGTAENDNLFFSVSARQLGKGLDEQLIRFLWEHPDAALIIIDTLQQVREVGGENYSYANDYQIITQLKSFADTYCKLNRYVTDGIERRYEINRQRGTFWRHYGNSLSWQEEKKLEHRKASVRCKVEYVFHIVKDLFHWRKARYKGLKKNEDYAYLAFASANLYMLTCFA